MSTIDDAWTFRKNAEFAIGRNWRALRETTVPASEDIFDGDRQFNVIVQTMERLKRIIVDSDDCGQETWKKTEDGAHVMIEIQEIYRHGSSQMTSRSLFVWFGDHQAIGVEWDCEVASPAVLSMGD